MILAALRRLLDSGTVRARHLMTLPFSTRQRRLSRSRKPITKEDFVDRIARAGGDTEAAALVWNHLQDWITVEGFTPYPEDSLGSVFGIVEEDLDEDLILKLLEKFSVPTRLAQQAADEYGPIDTPLQIALFITRCRNL